LSSRRWRTSARDPVGLFDERDVEADGLRGSRRRGEVRRVHSAARAVSKHQSRDWLFMDVQLYAGRTVGCLELDDDASLNAV
jgi:hypothetical protein